MYWNWYWAGWLHWASFAVAWHFHGWICGPEKTGPPFGWLVIVSAAPWPEGSSACRLLLPTARPVTRPSRRPFSRTANALVMSVAPSFTRMSPGLTALS
jgi:hypothetical protein